MRRRRGKEEGKEEGEGEGERRRRSRSNRQHPDFTGLLWNLNELTTVKREHCVSQHCPWATQNKADLSCHRCNAEAKHSTEPHGLTYMIKWLIGLNEVLQLQNMSGATLVGGPGSLLQNDRQVTHVLWLAVPRCTLRKRSEAKSCSGTLAAMVLLGFSLMAHLYDTKST